MSLEILPTGYICPPGIRAVRDLLRKRLHLVRHRTSHLLSVQNLYARHLGVKVSGAAIKSMELDRASQEFSDVHLVLSLDSSLSTIGHLGEWIVRLERQMAESLRLRPEFGLLQSVSGVGKILAMTIALETHKIGRFRKVGRLCFLLPMRQERTLQKWQSMARKKERQSKKRQPLHGLELSGSGSLCGSQL